MIKQLPLKQKQSTHKQMGGLTVEFVFGMIIAAAILTPTFLLFLDTSKEVINAFIGWISKSWP